MVRLRRLRQVDHPMFKVSLVYIVRPYIKNKTKFMSSTKQQATLPVTYEGILLMSWFISVPLLRNTTKRKRCREEVCQSSLKKIFVEKPNA